ncbi:MAG: outer membrane lipoprotein carrier protein LolA [Pseudomonadota bacterium]
MVQYLSLIAFLALIIFSAPLTTKAEELMSIASIESEILKNESIEDIHAPQMESQSIQKAESYLQNLTTVKANFIQTAHNGARLSGTFYLNRPGKLRFDYNEIDDFIVADGLFIYFYDSELGEQTNAPIGQTLADFLLRENLELDGDLSVQSIGQEQEFKTITLSESGNEGAGSVKLFFHREPYALKKWQVTDAAGLVTEVSLHDIERDIDLPAKLFAYLKPSQDKPTFNQ